MQCVCSCHGCAKVIFKTATGQQKAFCVLKFSKCESLIAVQRAFRQAYKCKLLIQQSILSWYQQSHNDGTVDVAGMTRHCFLSPRDFFVWRYIKDVPPLPTTYDELRSRITTVFTTIDANNNVWSKLNYLLDICCNTKRAHIEHL